MTPEPPAATTATTSTDATPTDTTWDPAAYARFTDHRSRPFADLVARVRPERDPRLVVDLGCGDGSLTLSLARRWPDARVVGVDSSTQMLDRARELDRGGRVEWVQARGEDWDPAALGAPIDVLVTNAALQWMPTHRELLPGWLAALAPGGWFAMQVPGNFDAPSHALMRGVLSELPRGAALVPTLRRAVASAGPEEYLRILASAGLVPDAWETTYAQVLPAGGDEHPVLSWVRSTGLRPVLTGLADDPETLAAFLAEYEARLESAYPRTDLGVVLPFRRVFAVGHRPDAAGDPAPAGVSRLDHVQVACAAGGEDAQRAFYAGLLGMRERPKPRALAARGGCWFAGGSAVIHVGVEPDFAPAAKAHPCLVVADLDALAARLTAAGHPLTWDDAIPGVRRLHTTDGAGNRVELQQA